MKIYSLLLVLIIMLTGCTQQEPCIPEKITVYDTSYVYVPVKPKRPNIECSLDSEDDMFDCIVLQKKIINELTE